jgi:hypothetical protein
MVGSATFPWASYDECVHISRGQYSIFWCSGSVSLPGTAAIIVLIFKRLMQHYCLSAQRQEIDSIPVRPSKRATLDGLLAAFLVFHLDWADAIQQDDIAVSTPLASRTKQGGLWLVVAAGRGWFVQYSGPCGSTTQTTLLAPYLYQLLCRSIVTRWLDDSQPWRVNT